MNRGLVWRANVWLLLLVAPLAAQQGPGRIAVGGVWPTGYVGALARHGLPRDLLYDEQLADPEVLGRYDLVIIAGAPPNVPDLMPAVAQLMSKGGALLVDYSGIGPGLRGLFATAGGQGPAAVGVAGRSLARVELTGGHNALARALNFDLNFTMGHDNLVPVVTEGAVTLAEYTATSPLPPPGPPDEEREKLRRQRGDEGPRAPAILLRREGPGRLLICGPAVGFATGLLGQDMDRLILSMVHLLTDGRAQAQVEPEGAHLARAQSGRTVNRNVRPAAKVRPPIERPDGSGAAGALPQGFTLLEKQPADEYNVGGWLASDRAEVLCNYWNGNSYLRVELGRSGVRIGRVTGGSFKVLGASAARLQRGSRFVLKERAGRLSVVAGAVVASADITGIHRGAVATKGAVTNLEYQPIEDVYFTDDFMRTNDSSGGWETFGGQWQTAPVQNPDMGANPFSYKADAPNEVATAINGRTFWDDYRFTCAVRPNEPTGRVGLGFYAQDAKNLYLFAVRVRQGAKLPDGFAFVRVVDGQPEIVKSCAGGLQAGQWYELQVRCDGASYTALVDGQPVLTAEDAYYAGGAIALRAENTRARFDDVAVEANEKENDRGQNLKSKVPDFAGLMDLDSWAGPALQWEADAAQPGLFWRRNSFFGDLMLRLEPATLPDGARLMLLAEGDGASTDSGYSVTLQRTGATASLELRHRGQVVSKGQAPVREGVVFELGKSTNGVLGLVDNRVVVHAPRGGKVEGGRVAFQVVGFKPKLSAVTLWATNLRDYAFDTAPVDWWVASGTWDVSNRWSCTPDWSWFGGVGEQAAAIWHKQPMQGDTVLDFYAGAKMVELSGQKVERTGDFNAALCGDGQDPDSGYAFQIHPPAGGAILRRRGQEVARNDRFRLFIHGHNRWANIRAERRGDRVQLYVDDQRVLDWPDPTPLPGGYAGIWTYNNGIMVARVTLSYEQPAKPWLSLR